MTSEQSVKVPDGLKKTEIGEIPEDWDVRSLPHVFNVIDYRGRTPPFSDNGIPYIGADNIKNESIVFSNRRYVSDETYEQYMTRGMPNPGDILFTTEAPLGKVAQAPNYKFCLAQRLVAFQCKNDYDPTFFMYILKSDVVQKQFLDWSTGTTVKGISAKNMKFIKLPYPRDVTEQKRIGRILSQVDEHISHTEAIIEKTEELKKGLMQQLLTKGIGHTKFKKTEIGEIPEEWDVCEFGNITSQLKETTLPDANGVYVGLEHIDSGQSFLTKYGNSDSVKSLKFIFNEKNILYGKLRPYLDKAVIATLNGICSTDIVVIKNKNNSDISFILYVLHSKRFVDYATNTSAGSNLPRTSWNEIAKYKVAFPPLGEQQKIGQILTHVDDQLSQNQTYLSHLQELKKGLMQDLLTGKVRVGIGTNHR